MSVTGDENKTNLEPQTTETEPKSPYPSSEEEGLKEKVPLPLNKRKCFIVPMKTIWPSEVKSRMNVAEWERLMKEVNLHEDIPYITNGFKDGFCLGIPQHQLDGMKWYTPPNHASAVKARREIEATMAKEAREGRLAGPFTREQVYEKYGFFRTNPMGSAVNGDGTVRLINDLSHPKNNETIPSVNSFVDKKNYETYWDGFDDVAKFLSDNPGEWELAIFDWEKAYRQLPVHPCQRRFLCILDFQDRVWIDLAVGFGGVASCGVFGGPAEVWKLITKSTLDLRAIFRWVDDNLIFRRPGDEISLKDVTNLSTSLGVRTNTTKNFDFAEEQKYTGFIWNGKNHTVRLPEKKLEERLKIVEDLLVVEATWSFDTIESLVGKLGHTVHIVPHMAAYLRSFYRWMKEWKEKRAKRKTPEDVRSDLLEWQICLATFESLTLIPNSEPLEVDWVGDASSSYGIGIQVGNHWACFKFVDGWQGKDLAEGKRTIAWAETVAVRLGLLVLKKVMTVRGKAFWIDTDNTTTQATIKKRKSKDRQTNEEWKQIQRLLTVLGCNIKERRVTSKENKADDLSRGYQGDRPWYNEVIVTVPDDLRNLLAQSTPTEGDAPATRNREKKTFIKSKPDNKRDEQIDSPIQSV